MAGSDFSAYFDESGTKADTQAVVVAGFIAPTEQWLAFERDWKSILSMFGVNSLHMRHFAHSTGEYVSWKGNESRRRDFLSRLIGTIKIRAHHSFACAVLMDAYRLADSKYKLHEVITPYTLAARTCVGKAYDWAKHFNINEDHIAFFFEDGSEDKSDLMRRMERDGKRAPVFLTKNQSVVFQAADLLAYEHLLANTRFRAGKITEYDDLRHPPADRAGDTRTINRDVRLRVCAPPQDKVLRELRRRLQMPLVFVLACRFHSHAVHCPCESQFQQYPQPQCI
jgi:Protein of unknown function (DUF3800)